MSIVFFSGATPDASSGPSGADAPTPTSAAAFPPFMMPPPPLPPFFMPGMFPNMGKLLCLFITMVYLFFLIYSNYGFNFLNSNPLLDNSIFQTQTS